MDRREALGTIPSTTWTSRNGFQSCRSRWHFLATPAINPIWALQESIRIAKEEGRQGRYDRHRKNARAMQAVPTELLHGPGPKRATALLTCPTWSTRRASMMPNSGDVVMEEGMIVAGGLAAHAGRCSASGTWATSTSMMVAALGIIERTLQSRRHR